MPEVRLVPKTDIDLLDLPLTFDKNALRVVDHDLGDRSVFEQRLQRSKADNAVDDGPNNILTFLGGEDLRLLVENSGGSAC